MAEEHIYNDKELFARIAIGDEAAFTTAFNMFLPKLYPFIIKFTRSEHATREIVQETFIRLWLNRDKLEEIENPGGWLFKVASNECYTYARKAGLFKKNFNSFSSELGTTASPEDWLEGKELNKLIREAVDQLPPRRKAIYQLSRDQGKSIPEIAEVLNLSPNTVKNALVSSLRSIREYLGRAGISLFALLFLFD